jgi:hypothetical protein
LDQRIARPVIDTGGIMNKHVIALLAVCATASGCAAAPGAELEESVGKVGMPLLSTCSAEAEQDLRNNAIWAGLAADYARQAQEDDPNNELIIRYFGEGYDVPSVAGVLLRLAMIGKGSKLTFDCHDPAEVPECANKDVAVWVLDNGQTTGDRTMHVCGDRFWEDQYVNGEDSGSGASQVGIMVHEISHLAGAVDDGVRTEEDTIAMAADYRAVPLTPRHADSYRFYVMKQ